MLNQSTEFLSELFSALQAERERLWEPDKLAANAAQRRHLVETFDPDRVAKAGEQLDSYGLIDVESGEIGLADLVARGPAVLIFFRFGGCPACNIALPYYDRNLWPTLYAANIPLVAVSPQKPEGLKDIRDRHQLRLRVASDPDNRLARRLGISFVPENPPQPSPGWIGELTGIGTAELPQPTVVVLEQDLSIRSIQVSPDWLVRAEADEILAQLPETTVKAIA